MGKEIKSLQENNTWELVKPPSDCRVVDCRWVYKLKKCPDGSTKYKARLVARGFSQIYGENYWETYAPVVKCSTVRLLLASAVVQNWLVEQVDVRNAYVKSELKEQVYMRQPYGFEEGDGLVCELKKSLYGLKQAGHEWSVCLSQFLTKEMKFQRLVSDPCVYTNGTGDRQVIISVYVDDILIFSRDKVRIDRLKERLHAKFEIEDLGACRKITGIEVVRESDRLSIHQGGYIEELVDMYEMREAHPEKTPMNSSLELCCPQKDCKDCQLVDEGQYRALIGRLLYLAGASRPDISFAVSSLSRFNNKPHEMHLRAAKRVLRYLKETRNYCITYKKGDEDLFVHSDADYGNCKESRRSYTGFVVMFAGGPIAWEAKRQSTVALSSTEAEYMAVTSAAREIMFFREVLLELNFCEPMRAINLFSDNMSAIAIAKKIGFSPRTKHISIRHHYIRELVENGSIKLNHVGTSNMIADICTKSLGPIKQEMNVKRLLDSVGV